MIIIITITMMGIVMIIIAIIKVPLNWVLILDRKNTVTIWKLA